MRKDRVSMKAMLENARALRTASLSGRKNQTNQTTKPGNRNSSSSPLHTTHSLKMDQMQFRGPTTQPMYVNNMSYQFSQPLSQSAYSMHPSWQYQNEVYNMDSMSQFSRQCQYQEDGLAALRIQQDKLEREKLRKAKCQQKAIEILKVLNEELNKHKGGLNMPAIFGHVKDNFLHLKLRKERSLTAQMEAF